MHGRGRREADGLADLAHGRRVAVPVDVIAEKAPDLALPAGQLGCRLHLTLRGSGTVSNVCSTAGYALLRTESRLQTTPAKPASRGRADDKTAGAVLECAGEDLNLHGLLRPLGPQPSASTNSATSARARAV